jgi:hypothetical protein
MGGMKDVALAFEHRAAGVATVRFGEAGRRLTYRCEPHTHQVTVEDDFGRVLMAFGGRGRAAGSLDTPLDLAFVRPTFSGERLPAAGLDGLWVAVADYGNKRIQVFELDGVHVGTVDLSDQPGLGAPCSVAWQSPLLEIEGVEGARTRIYLSAALLCGLGHLPSDPARPRGWASQRASVN